MGQRANLIVVKDNSYELYYSHWCASTLPMDLFWGPEYAVNFIEKQKKVDKSDWLDDIWAEGGTVLDWDRKKLLLYGGEDLRYDIPMRNLFLRLMRTAWQEWEIEWAHEGILDMAVYVGYPKEKVLSRSKVDLNDLSLAPPGERKWVEMVASVKFSPTEMLLFPLEGEIDDYLPNGPDLINKINKSYGYRSISLAEWSEHFPTSGLHIDVQARRLEFWHARDLPGISHKLQTSWPDWKVIDCRGRYETQSERTDGLLQFQPVDQNKLLESIKASLLHESSNPTEAIVFFVKRESDAGKTVEVNPNALRYDASDTPKNAKEKILERAIESLRQSNRGSL